MNASEGESVEKKLVRCGAQNKSSKPLVDQRRGFGGAGKTMDKHRTLVEGMHAVELEDFLHAFFIDPLRSMQNERQIGSAFCEFAGQLWFKGERVCPTKLRDDADREPGVH